MGGKAIGENNSSDAASTIDPLSSAAGTSPRTLIIKVQSKKHSRAETNCLSLASPYKSHNNRHTQKADASLGAHMKLERTES